MVSFETVCDKDETCQYSVEISVEYRSQSRPMPRSTGVRGDLRIAFINGPQVPHQADPATGFWGVTGQLTERPLSHGFRQPIRYRGLWRVAVGYFLGEHATLGL